LDATHPHPQSVHLEHRASKPFGSVAVFGAQSGSFQTASGVNGAKAHKTALVNVATNEAVASAINPVGGKDALLCTEGQTIFQRGRVDRRHPVHGQRHLGGAARPRDHGHRLGAHPRQEGSAGASRDQGIDRDHRARRSRQPFGLATAGVTPMNRLTRSPVST
jgi:hypothetical protein